MGSPDRTCSWTRSPTGQVLSLLGWLSLVSCRAGAPPPIPSREPPRYVGRESCARCHGNEDRAWRGSHHDLAMQEATAGTVLGDFENKHFAYHGVVSTFTKREGRFYVRTDGPDGRLHDYEVAYAFGVYPLQQYLIAFPGGRYQALNVCWDARPAGQGGQRWFHLYPNENVTFRDPFHWTGPYQNWNFMCAECHSTNLRKGYRPEDDRYETRFSEMDVACEACHGPGSEHLAWAGEVEAGRRKKDEGPNGLLVSLKDKGKSGTWEIELPRGIAKRDVPRTSWAELETCARCHARRSVLSEDYRPGRPLLDTYRPALLAEALYHPDGQIQDEVYEYGSFLQSRMYRAGVSCSDCHEPHGLKVRVSKDVVCSACHLQEKFASPRHHFHRADSEGSSCVGCHMPARNYMVVHARRDHSLRVPRPDLSLRLGTPNPCNTCHADRSVEWAAASAQKWWPRLGDRPEWGTAIDAGRRGLSGSAALLAALARDRERPAMVRATAVSLLGARLSPVSVSVIAEAARDDDPLVRLAALEPLAALSPPDRVRLAAPGLRDAVRAVRVDAARALAVLPEGALAPEQRPALAAALLEWEEAQAANADRAEARANLCGFHAELGQMADAERECRAAVRLNRWFAPGFVSLAEVLRQSGREGEAEGALRDGLAASPTSADLHHALGLSLARQKRTDEALASLRRAAQLDEAAGPRYAYVLAVALHDSGRGGEALSVLEKALARHPGDPDLLVALASYNRERGALVLARGYAERLVALDPEDRAAQALLAQVSRPPTR